MTKCPNCFRLIPDNAMAQVCHSGACPRFPDPKLLEFTAKTAPPRGLVTVRQRPAQAPRNWSFGPPQCLRCGGPAQECCPTCHYVLPARWREGDATCIAMAGARATGKTLFIAVVVKLLATALAAERMALQPANATTDQIYREHYERQLFEERQILPPTRPADTGSFQTDPLIFSVARPGSRPRFLVLRDIAGEDLERAGSTPTHLSFLGHADTVLFLFDPMNVDAVRDKLPGIVNRQLARGGDPVKVLQSVLLHVGGGRPDFAVAVSKTDTVQALDQVKDEQFRPVLSNRGAAIQRDPGWRTVRYDEDDALLVHEETRSLLALMGADSIINIIETHVMHDPARLRYFVVSALGDSPTGERLERGIAPFRCLDPIKWALRRDFVL